MRIRGEFAVEKRDGRGEWLRATKIGRSILLALGAVDARAVSDALALGAAVMRRLSDREVDAPISTQVIAEVVQHVLVEAGRADAAARFERIGLARRHRRSVLAGCGLAGSGTGGSAAGGSPAHGSGRGSSDTDSPERRRRA